MVNIEMNSYITNKITHAIDDKQMFINIKDLVFRNEKL